MSHRYKLIADCAKCRDCGDPVHDFDVSDELWNEVIGIEGVWCWDCFADRANQKGIWGIMAVVMTLEEFRALAAGREEEPPCDGDNVPAMPQVRNSWQNGSPRA